MSALPSAEARGRSGHSRCGQIRDFGRDSRAERRHDPLRRPSPWDGEWSGKEGPVIALISNSSRVTLPVT